MTIAGTGQPRHLGPGRGEQMQVMSDVVTIKAAATQTGDAYSLFEIETPPAGEWPAHTQRHDDETFYVLSGTYAFRLGDEEIELGPGGYVFVPRGTVHAFLNVGAEAARMLVLVTPGGIQELFFDEVGNHSGHPVSEAAISRVLAVAPKYGIDFEATAAVAKLTPTGT